jgi:hypothetical protein
MKKISSIVLILLLLTGGCAGREAVFSATNAIQQVLKEHPDFPAQPGEVKTVWIPTGGMAGAAAWVDYQTAVEKTAAGNYQVTLTKDWHLTVNGRKVFSYWQYKVSPDGATLVKSDDRDSLPDTMK